MDDRETDAELLARYARVSELVSQARKAAAKCKPGATRDRKSRWAGCLLFTQLQIESELGDRGLCQN